MLELTEEFEEEIRNLCSWDQDLWVGRSDGGGGVGGGCMSSPGQRDQAWLGKNRSKPWRRGCKKDKTETSPEGAGALAEMGDR